MRSIFLILLPSGILPKISWCIQNFLTMEFYRKICRKCYWNNVYKSESTFLKNTLLLLVSILPLLFLSFFYLPTDPANSSKTSSALRSIKLFLLLRLRSAFAIDSLAEKTIYIASFRLDMKKIFSSGDDLCLSYSVLRI